MDQLHTAVSEVGVSIGSTVVDAAWAGLAPGFVGVFQVNITLPANMQTGVDLPMRVNANGVPSQSGVTVSVQ